MNRKVKTLSHLFKYKFTIEGIVFPSIQWIKLRKFHKTERNKMFSGTGIHISMYYTIENNLQKSKKML